MHLVLHPLVHDALATLRDVSTTPETFRHMAVRISLLLASEATRDVPTLAPWGAVQDIARIGTGTWDQLCAIQTDGDVFCSGYGFGLVPTQQAMTASRFWVDTFGELQVDDDTIFRASQARAECAIDTTGLVCSGNAYGPAGDIVDGGFVDGSAVCWLTDNGSVECSGNTKNDYFDAGRVLAFAYSYYTDSMCAVYDDGSIWGAGLRVGYTF